MLSYISPLCLNLEFFILFFRKNFIPRLFSTLLNVYQKAATACLKHGRILEGVAPHAHGQMLVLCYTMLVPASVDFSAFLWLVDSKKSLHLYFFVYNLIIHRRRHFHISSHRDSAHLPTSSTDAASGFSQSPNLNGVINA